MQLALSVCLVAFVIVAFMMLSYLLYHNTNYSAKYHFVLCLALMFYALGYFMEINAADEAQVMMALQVENIGIPIIGPFFLLCMMQLCDSRFLRGWMGYAASGHAMLVFLMVITNRYHGLFYTSVGITFGEWTQITVGHGPLFFYNQILSVACVLPALVMLVQRFLAWTSSMRRRMSMIIVGAAVTLVANVVNVLDLLPTQLDITVFAYGITMVCFFIGVQRNRLYELQWLGASQAAQTMEDAMVVLDADGGLAYFNDTAGKLFPDLKRVNTNTPVHAVKGLPEMFYHPMVSGSMDQQCQTPRGERHFRCSVIDVGGNGWSIVLRDTTQTVMLTRRLEEFAEIDDLTNIYNRRHFLELLRYEILRIRRHPEKASLILFDIDYFKRVNDTYGHAAGDETLICVTKAVKRVLRASDLFGRYGGEEFLIYCPYTDKQEAINLAERIRGVISQTVVHFEGVDINVNASFGITEIDPDEEMETLIDCADQAMYNAKRNGRNQVIVYKRPA